MKILRRQQNPIKVELTLDGWDVKRFRVFLQMILRQTIKNWEDAHAAGYGAMEEEYTNQKRVLQDALNSMEIKYNLEGILKETGQLSEKEMLSDEKIMDLTKNTATEPLEFHNFTQYKL